MSKNWLAWTWYIVLRLAVFLVPLAVLLLLGVPDYLAAIFAALIGVSLSVLLLSKQRGAVSETIYARRQRTGKTKRDRAAEDNAEEDAALDAIESSGDNSPESGSSGSAPTAQ